MRGIAERMADRFTCTLLDWPGFGESTRQSAPYDVELYTQCLRYFRTNVAPNAVALVAAGHAASWVVRAFGGPLNGLSSVVFIAPTWRGPMPTAMGRRPGLYALLRALICLPGLGHALYRLNTSERFLRRMAGRHVFSQATFLNSERIDAMQRLARRRGARFASAAFVTGKLDAYATRERFLTDLHQFGAPIGLVIGQSTPSKSLADMNAMAALPGIKITRVPGALAPHVESPGAMVEWIAEFLKKYRDK
jgi:pimeloyl-ACP methyl ester carboxylesterase